MAKQSAWQDKRFDTPATYRIRIEGRIDRNWADRLGGMALAEDTRADPSGVTILVGHLPDQTALSGVLNTLYDLHLPILSVENLDENRRS